MGWTQEALALKLSVGQSTISGIELAAKRAAESEAENVSPASALLASRFRRLMEAELAGFGKRPEPVGLNYVEDVALPYVSWCDLHLWQHPKHGGDFAFAHSFGQTVMFVAVVDIVGNGTAVSPQAEFMRGWLAGRVGNIYASIPNLRALAEEYLVEFGANKYNILSPALFCLITVPNPKVSNTQIETISCGLPAPVLVHGISREPLLAKSTSIQASDYKTHQVSWLLSSNDISGDWELVILTDGALESLGDGNQDTGRRVMLRHLQGRLREMRPGDFIEGRLPSFGASSDMLCLSVRSKFLWDEEKSFESSPGQDHHNSHSLVQWLLDKVQHEGGWVDRMRLEQLRTELKSVLDPLWQAGRRCTFPVRIRWEPGELCVEITDPEKVASLFASRRAPAPKLFRLWSRGDGGGYPITIFLMISVVNRKGGD
jgi:hypothetical protein